MSQQTLALVSKYLDTEKVNCIVLELSENLLSHQGNSDSLCDLLDQVDQRTIDAVTNQGRRYLDLLVGNVTENWQVTNFVKLANKLPQLYEEFMDKIDSILSRFVNSSSHKFIPEIMPSLHQQLKLLSIELTDSDSWYELEYIIYILRFIEIAIRANPNASVPEKIDRLLCYLVTLNVEEIYEPTLRLLKWRMSSIIKFSDENSFFWNIIFALASNKNKNHQTNGYILWVKFLNNSSPASFHINQFFQTKILQNENYFNHLQTGLVSESPEHRKLCISILKLSILSINSNICTPIFVWDSSRSNDYMKEWERFLTVFEIMAIDTSLHQAEAASSDILSLITPDSLIHPSWGFRLLSTGFRAGTDSIRKFALNLLLSLPPSNLYLFKHALPILEDIFLPYMMTANHLIVHDNECSYGETLTTYIRAIITSCHSTSERQELTKSIFVVINNSKAAFDPCKIYVLLGVLLGLKSAGEFVLEFGKHDDLLVPLFEIKSEGILYHKVLQTITLRLLLKFKFQLLPFLRCMDRFIRFNSSSLINDNMALIKDYLVLSGVTKEDLDSNLEGTDDFIKAIALYFKGIISSDKDGFPLFKDSSLFAYLIGTQLDLTVFQSEIFNNWIDESLLEVLQSACNANIYEALSNSGPIAVSRPRVVDELWNEIQSENLLEDETVLRSVVYKYRVLNNLLSGDLKAGSGNMSLPFNIDSLIQFKKLIFKNFKSSTIQVKDFYKVKEEMLGEFYRTIDCLVIKGLVDSGNVNLILPEISSNLSNYGSNFHITSFLGKILNLDIIINSLDSTEEINSILEILLQIWDNLADIRLQLHQKDLHTLLIETILHYKILNTAIDNEDLIDLLIVFTKSVIKNSTARRSLLPTLTRCISKYQINHPQAFDKSIWLCEVLTESFTMYQLNSNAFKLEPIIGKLFDDYFGNDSDPLYLRVYQLHEIASKINLLAVFNSIKSSVFATALLSYILDNGKKYNLYKVIKSTDAYEQWIRLRLSIIILSIISVVDDSLVEESLPIFIGLLGSDPSPLVRIYLEWIISLKIIDFPQFKSQILDHLQKLMSEKEMKPTLVCCYQRILLLLINQLPSLELSTKIESLQRLLSIVISGATSNKALVRHFSTSLICNVYLQLTNDSHTTKEIDQNIQEIMHNIYQSTSQIINLNEYRNGDAVLWDIEKDLTLVNISGVILMRASDHLIEYVTRDQILEELSSDQLENLNVTVGEDKTNLWIPYRKNQHKKSTLNISSAELLNKNPLQTKSGAWSSIMDIDDEQGDEIDKGNDVSRSDLIVVSSLVDKAPNLGGICRLCDVLGAGLLTLHDIDIKNHPEFKNVAVTADYWMPMCEVPVDSIIPFLRQKKQEGYTLIGLEQTDKSVQLNNDLKFPQKSLVLLGKEREGIPGDLLAELDFCVEIKQVGVVRSMNIQTATAVIVHAYSSQHC